jgi:hypothetical protein
MHEWLKGNQSKDTGLVLSFYEDRTNLRDTASVYDQALAVCVFLLFDNLDGARSIIDFFNERLTVNFNGFSNVYHFGSGDTAVSAVNSGPNIWLGVAVIQYIKKTNDAYYISLARAIADWLIKFQGEDPDMGIKGGSGVAWYSKENNMDAYAFFDMLYQLTKDNKYAQARDNALSWLKKYSFGLDTSTAMAFPANRGKGDATIPTPADNLLWSLSSVGPKVLYDIKMNPEKIIKQAGDEYTVNVDYKRPSGAVVNIRGFDSIKNTRLSGAGIVSPEITAQSVLSYCQLSDYFLEQKDTLRSAYYQEKARTYLKELNKLIISSQSKMGHGEGCLPYSSSDNADTGHGWILPESASTCSIAATAYTIMAIKEYNPLKFNE